MTAADYQRKPPVRRCEERVARILADVEAGETLTSACRLAGQSVRAFYSWVESDPSLDARLARAREIGFDTIADRIRQTARGEAGWSSGDVKRDRLIADVDLKLLACWDRRYSQRHVVAGDPEAPLAPPPPEGRAGEILVAMLDVLRARQQTAERLGWSEVLDGERVAFLQHEHPADESRVAQISSLPKPTTL